MSYWDDALDLQDLEQKNGLPTGLLSHVLQTESAGNPNATSSKGAVGLFQFMPDTAKEYNIDPTDPHQAAQGAAKMFADLSKKYNGNVPKMLAAYNWGQGNVDKNGLVNAPDETKNYIGKVMAGIGDVSDNKVHAQNENKSYLDKAASAIGNAIVPQAQAEEMPKEGPQKTQIATQDDFDKELLGFKNTSKSQDAQASSVPSQNSTPQDDFDKELLNYSPAQLANKNSQQKAPVPLPKENQNSGPISSAANAIDKFTQTMGNSATFGLGNKAAALGAATAEQLKGSNNNFSQDYQSELKNRLQQESEYAKENPIASGTANVLGAVGGARFNPEAVIPPTLAGKVAQGAGQGAVVGGLAGLGKAKDENFPEDVKSIAKGAEFGGITGAAIPIAFQAGKSAVNALTSHGINPETAELAKAAEEKYGIPISGPQLSNNQFVKYLSSMTDKLPFSGAGARAEEQSQAFTRAVADTMLPEEALSKEFASPEDINFLQNAKGLTPKFMSTTRKTLGNMFNKVAENTVINPEAASDLSNKLASISSEAGQSLAEQETKPLSNQMNNILSKLNEDGTIDGKAYQALTRKDSPLSVATSSANPNIRYYAGQIRNALDDALEASSSPEDLNILKQARLGYKNMKTVQDLAAKSGIEGEISPNLLLNAVKKSYKDLPYAGGGDIGELARITKLMREPPSSGTAERLTAMRILELAGGGGLTVGTGAELPVAASVAGLVGGGKAVNSFLNSDYYKNKVLQSAFNNPGVTSNFLNSAAAPQAAILGVNRLQPNPVISSGNSINR